jgi:hypothetical protein
MQLGNRIPSFPQSFSSFVVVLVLDPHAREQYQPVGPIDHGLFDPHRSNQRSRTRTTTRTRTIGGSGLWLWDDDEGEIEAKLRNMG